MFGHKTCEDARIDLTRLPKHTEINESCVGKLRVVFLELRSTIRQITVKLNKAAQTFSL